MDKTYELDDGELIEVTFYHDINKERYRQHRTSNKKYQRTDRFNYSRPPMVDTKFCKRNLHRFNRKHPEISETNYYHNHWNLKTWVWAMS